MKRRELLAGIVALVGLSTAQKAWSQPPEAPPSANRPLPVDVVPVTVKNVLQSTRTDDNGKETSVNVVVLQGGDEALLMRIWIGEAEATSILRSMNGEMPARPMAHDLMASLVKALGGQVKSVTISSIPNETFYAATVKVAGKNVEENVDARPSDAIALALRTQAPLYVERKLLKPLDLTH